MPYRCSRPWRSNTPTKADRPSASLHLSPLLRTRSECADVASTQRSGRSWPPTADQTSPDDAAPDEGALAAGGPSRHAKCASTSDYVHGRLALGLS